ncbi:hypothetical protein PBCV1_A658R [Paramecium bursaria Chlorella virus 1]|uniref:Uncharacterized protein n=1 Tax=Paramecium bursaria Chlorella virus 1 TaxID=10506 RepID=O41140_PBCV1|nr:hypothetical protein PBCV1_A658R [Paramecium bursaria Chlorella virus 1]AAC96976.1 hypothetical protein [Paramecium bursaria Chlorella virus 1]
MSCVSCFEFIVASEGFVSSMISGSVMIFLVARVFFTIIKNLRNVNINFLNVYLCNWIIHFYELCYLQSFESEYIVQTWFLGCCKRRYHSNVKSVS